MTKLPRDEARRLAALAPSDAVVDRLVARAAEHVELLSEQRDALAAAFREELQRALKIERQGRHDMEESCSAVDCGNVARARGLCHMHDEQARRRRDTAHALPGTPLLHKLPQLRVSASTWDEMTRRVEAGVAKSLNDLHRMLLANALDRPWTVGDGR